LPMGKQHAAGACVGEPWHLRSRQGKCASPILNLHPVLGDHLLQLSGEVVQTLRRFLRS